MDTPALLAPVSAADPVDSASFPQAPAAAVLLSICVPTYHRPQLLARTLRSLGPLPNGVEVLVSDNSLDDDSQVVTQRELASQPAGQWRYYHNPPGATLIDNWNACVQRARGYYVLMLHDDDYLLPGAVATLVQTLQRTQGRHEAILFGVQVVDEHERVRRHQGVRRAQFLAPQQAVHQLLTNSSLVRMPAMVVSRGAYFTAGMLDPVQEGTGDLDIWLRVCVHCGLYRVPATTAAYTVHNGALTASMFQERTVNLLLRIFEQAQQQELLPPRGLAAAKTHFFHQFVLAGTVRSLRNRNLVRARRVLELLEHPSLSQLEVSLRWLPLRWLLQLLACVVPAERPESRHSPSLLT
ncbi:glycosyltransferase [Hymenobacter seoulensis]